MSSEGDVRLMGLLAAEEMDKHFAANPNEIDPRQAICDCTHIERHHVKNTGGAWWDGCYYCDCQAFAIQGETAEMGMNGYAVTRAIQQGRAKVAPK